MIPLFSTLTFGQGPSYGTKAFVVLFFEPGPIGRTTVGKTLGFAQILPLGAGVLQPIGILVLKATFG